MIGILYVSTLTKEYSKIELNVLLDTFKFNNNKHNITGLLLYHDRNIIQYIEGENNIFDLYSNILDDNRHKNVITLFTKKISERKFKNWDLEYVKVDKIVEIMFLLL